jgi:hypothetical protein
VFEAQGKFFIKVFAFQTSLQHFSVSFGFFEKGVLETRPFYKFSQIGFLDKRCSEIAGARSLKPF